MKRITVQELRRGMILVGSFKGADDDHLSSMGHSKGEVILVLNDICDNYFADVKYLLNGKIRTSSSYYIRSHYYQPIEKS